MSTIPPEVYPKMEILEIKNKVQVVLVKLQVTQMNPDPDNQIGFSAYQQITSDSVIRKALDNEKKTKKRIYRPKIILPFENKVGVFSLYIKKKVGGWKISSPIHLIWATDFMEPQKINLIIPGFDHHKKDSIQKEIPISLLSSSDCSWKLDQPIVRKSGQRKRKKVEFFGDMVDPDEMSDQAPKSPEKRQRSDLRKDEDLVADVLAQFGNAQDANEPEPKKVEEDEVQTEEEEEVPPEKEEGEEVQTEEEQEVQTEEEEEVQTEEEEVPPEFNLSLEKFGESFTNFLDQACKLECKINDMKAQMNRLKDIQLDESKQKVEEAKSTFLKEKECLDRLISLSDQNPLSEDLRKKYVEQSSAFDQYWKNLQEVEQKYHESIMKYDEVKSDLIKTHNETKNLFRDIVKNSPWK
jgi:hypothetical protein